MLHDKENPQGITAQARGILPFQLSGGSRGAEKSAGVNGGPRGGLGEGSRVGPPTTASSKGDLGQK